MREIVHLQAGQCGNQIGSKVNCTHITKSYQNRQRSDLSWLAYWVVRKYPWIFHSVFTTQPTQLNAKLIGPGVLHAPHGGVRKCSWPLLTYTFGPGDLHVPPFWSRLKFCMANVQSWPPGPTLVPRVFHDQNYVCAVQNIPTSMHALFRLCNAQ